MGAGRTPVLWLLVRFKFRARAEAALSCPFIYAVDPRGRTWLHRSCCCFSFSFALVRFSLPQPEPLQPPP